MTNRPGFGDHGSGPLPTDGGVEAYALSFQAVVEAIEIRTRRFLDASECAGALFERRRAEPLNMIRRDLDHPAEGEC